jgi:hypothetical protein
MDYENLSYNSGQDVFVVGAEFLSLAWGAVGAGPGGVELLHGLSDDGGIVGNDAGLGVSSVLAFGAHSGAGRVGAARGGEASVNDHGFEMDSRA